MGREARRSLRLMLFGAGLILPLALVAASRLTSEWQTHASASDGTVTFRGQGNASHVRVGVLTLGGRGNTSTEAIVDALKVGRTGGVRLINAADVCAGVLGSVDVLVVPGGRGSEYEAALGYEGALAVQQFVRGGGGYVGVCGGAFLATGGYLGLVDAAAMTGPVCVGDKIESLASRGAGVVEFELTEAGRRVFEATPRRGEARYSSGPIIKPAGHAEVPDFVPLARFRTEIYRFDAQRGTMVGTPAMVGGKYGEGLVILFSPHPELTRGLERLIVDAVVAVRRIPADS